jgi:Zn-dependent protease
MEKINFALFFGHLAVYLFVWVFALTAHGALTAWLSNYFGDDTAKNAGRISLSPFVQADLVGTIILPTIAFALGWLATGIPFIGWGKRVPLNSENWRNPKLAGVVVTLASTFASILIAIVSFGILKTLLATGIADTNSFLQIIFSRKTPTEISLLAPIEIILWYSLAVNTVLALFSLIPFPPFSGGVALFSLLPEVLKPVKTFFNQFGLILALLFIYFFGITYVFTPLLNLILKSLIN